MTVTAMEYILEKLLLHQSVIADVHLAHNVGEIERME